MENVQDNDDWWKTATIYQIYPRSFYDSNSDGIGDLHGIGLKLDYLASLNIDAIWISPFFKSPMKDFGYDVSDYREVDSLFGDIDQFKSLISSCHQRGIKVIIDHVVSHTSDQHAWFKESRKDKNNNKSDWYVWEDPNPDGTPPNNWQSVFGGSAWEWDATRRQYYLHNFLTSQPDLNYHNESVQLQILDEFTFWLDLGVDGFRLDTVNYYFHDKQLRNNPPKDVGDDSSFMSGGYPYEFQNHMFDKNRPENILWLERLRKLLDTYEARMLMGEVGDMGAEKLMGEYTKGKNRLHTAYSFQFLRDKQGPEFIAQSILDLESKLEDGWPTWALSNHDVVRTATRWVNTSGDQNQQAKFFMVFLSALRGSLCLYNGEELGLPEAELEYQDIVDPYGLTFWPEYKGRDGCRTPMPWDNAAENAGFSSSRPWLPVVEAHRKLSVNLQEQNPDSLLHFTRSVLKWRKEQNVLLLGGITGVVADDLILKFKRVFEDNAWLCIFNFSNQPYSIPSESNWENILVPGQRCRLEKGSIIIEGFSYAMLDMGGSS